MADFHWDTEDERITLDRVRALVDEVAGDLDPDSRYVSELLAVLDSSTDVEDYRHRLADKRRIEAFRQDGSGSSNGERGASWVDDETWASMSLLEQTLANLVTGETRMMWAAEGAADIARLPDVLGAIAPPRWALSIPCSTGKEAFSLAIASLEAGHPLEVVGVDRQEAYVRRARSGLLVHHRRDLEGPQATYLSRREDGRVAVADAVRKLCSFEVGDVFTDELPQGPFPLVVCRNFLGYFRDDSLAAAFDAVARRVARGGWLLVDPFVTGGAEMAPTRELLAEAGFERAWDDAHYYRAGT